MPIESNCPGCGRRLQLADEHAGKQARCPICNTISTISDVVATESGNGTNPKLPSWFLRTPEGQTYGPATKQQLDVWVTEGRVSEDCHLRTDDQEEWVLAAEAYPVLSFYRPSTNTPHSNVLQLPAPRRDRGRLVLGLGILGLALAPIGVAAWIIGARDLREMRAGRLDPRGMGATHAGHLMGLVGTVVWIAVTMIVGIVAVFATAVGY